VMLTLGGPASRAAADATKTVPVVFSIVTDPVALKLVASAERPGGNVTGITSLDPQQAAAQLSLFKEVLPNLKTVAILSDKTIPGADASGMAPIDRANEAAANALGLRAQIIKLDNPPNLAAAFDAMVSENAGAVLVLETPIPFAHMRAIAEMAASRRVPAMLPGGQAAAGGLLRRRIRPCALRQDECHDEWPAGAAEAEGAAGQGYRDHPICLPQTAEPRQPRVRVYVLARQLIGLEGGLGRALPRTSMPIVTPWRLAAHAG
jgi:hypothetical protein